MKNGKQSEQLLKVLGGHSASLDRTSKCRGLSEQPLYSGGHKAMQHETRNWNNFDKCEPEQQFKNLFLICCKMKFISEISEIFDVRSNSTKVTKKESDDADNDFFFDIFDDITKRARLKLAWWMFKARQYQRRRQMDSNIHERRKLYEHASSHSCKNANKDFMFNNATRNGVTKRVSDNSNQQNNSHIASRHRRNVLDNVVTTSNDNSLGASVFDNGNIGANNLPIRCQRQGANTILPRQRVSTKDVKERVAVQLAARRKEIAGMTSSQRTAYFRKKYGLTENKS